jgi:transposase
MGKPYSMDLRERVVAAVAGGMSRNRAAKQFGIGVSTAINWVKRLGETGSVAPGKMGGHKPKAISGEHREWLLRRTKEGDFTLRALVAELAARGLKVDYRSGVRPRREAQLHTMPSALTRGAPFHKGVVAGEREIRTWRSGGHSGQSIKVASRLSDWCMRQLRNSGYSRT